MDITFDVVYSSPLVRARQTAEIVARSLELGDQLQLTNHLSPAAAYVDLVSQLSQADPATEAVLLVGHEPHLSGLISQLCTGGSSLGLTLKKGGLARLDLESAKPCRCATLEWLLVPRLLGPKRGAKGR